MKDVKTFLESEDFQKLEELSKDFGLSLSALIRIAVKQYLKKRK